jgi:branched-chain amino acid transport system substrate-binding protein
MSLRVICIIGSCFLYGCQQENPYDIQSTQLPQRTRPQNPNNDVIVRDHKIGVLLPLSGPLKNTGKSIQQAIEMALFQKNNPKVQIVVQDTQGTAQGALHGLNQLIKEKVSVVIGPLTSHEAGAIRPTLIQRGIYGIALTNNRKVSHPMMTTFGFAPEDQVKHILKYGVSRGLKSIVILIPQNELGQIMRSSLSSHEYIEYGDKFFMVSYNPQSSQLPQDLESLKGKSFDGLLMVADGKEALSILEALAYNEIDLSQVQYLGTGQWDNEDTWKVPGLLGAWFAAPSPEKRKAFEEAYKQNYGEVPPRLSSLGYDSLMLAMVFLDQKKRPHHQTFNGIDGLFNITPSGETLRKISVMEITAQGCAKIIDGDMKKNSSEK